LTAASAQAAKRCDWHGPISGGEDPYNKCVDFAALDGKTLDLPKNVTRISADGLSFCQPATPTTGSGDADIVFIYDNSGSMTADAAYINPATKDTSWHYLLANSSSNCYSMLIKPAQTMTYPSREGGNWSVRLMSGDGNAQCQLDIPGDPYNARGAVIRSAIDFLATTSPTSTAAAMSFSDKIDYLRPPVQMNNATNVALIKNSIKLDTNGGTVYRNPLAKAKEWLNDPALIKTRKQAIIFISDGAPNDNDYLSVVDKNIPIYSIYLSKSSTPDTANLKELSDLTKGTFTRVNPTDPLAMENLLKSIVSTITKNTLPKSATITNKSMSPPQTSKSVSVAARPDGGAGMVLDSIIGLKEGANQIEIRLTKEDNTVATYDFTMNVAGKEIGATGGNYSCWDMPTLTAIDPKTNTAPEVYSQTGGSYPLELKRSPSDLKDVVVAGTSSDNDKENIVLNKVEQTKYGVTQTGTFNYNPDKGAPGTNNGTLEVDGKGDLTFVWSHPRDPRETVTYILPGRVVPIINGKPTFQIANPVTQGETIDAGTLKGVDPVVIIDSKNNCIVNCSGTQNIQTSDAVPTWNLVVKSPIKYVIRVFDNLGQFVCESKGQMTSADWAKLAKSGDSASIQMKIVPVSKEGQQLGTGAYLMRAEVTALGDEVTKNSAGESIIVRGGKKEYLRRFGYVRR
jgi:hypothetical protein